MEYVYKCQICNKEIKLLKNHLRISHRLKIDEYFKIYPNEMDTYNKFSDLSKTERKKHSPNCIEFYLNKGYDKNKSLEMLEDHRSSLPFKNRTDVKPCQIGYWINKGYDKINAELKVKEFQSNDLITSIKKYGDEKGTLYYNNFIKSLEKRKDTEIFNYIKSGLSKEESILKYNKRRINISPRREEYWMNLGYSISESKQLISEWQILNSPRREEYWMNLGYSISESKQLISEWQDNISIETIIKHYNITFNEAVKKQDEFISKMLNTKLKLGLIHDSGLDDKNKYDYYKLMVISETNKNYRLYKDKIDENNLRDKYYHLDHMYSIFEGFKNNIDYKIIGSIYNLKIISSYDNLQKSTKCTLTLEKLKKLYNGHENKN